MSEYGPVRHKVAVQLGHDIYCVLVDRVTTQLWWQARGELVDQLPERGWWHPIYLAAHYVGGETDVAHLVPRRSSGNPQPAGDRA